MTKNSHLSIWINKYTIILYLLLGGALLVRIIGFDWNLPHNMLAPNEFDEYYTVKVALRVLRGRSLNPGSFMWPSLYFYIQAFAYGNYSFWMLLVGSLRSLNDLTVRQVYLVGRFTTVLFGVGNVFLVYLIAKRMYSKKVGLLAAFFLSFSLLHIRYSRVIRPDIPMAFLVTLSFLFIYLIYEKGKTRDYVLAAIFTGLSAGTKYTGIILIVVIFLAHLLHTVDSKKGVAKIFLDKRLFLVAGLVVLTFFLTTPYGLIQFAKLSRAVVGWSSGGLSEVTASQPAEVNSWVYYITHSLNHSLGYPLAIFSLAAIVYGIFTHRKKDILLISFPLLYYFIIGSFTRHGDRYILPIVPFLAIVAAMFLMRIVSRIPLSGKRRSLALVTAAFILIFLPGIKAIRYVQLMSEKGTRIEAKDWVKENIPRGKRIAYEFYFPHFSGYKMENIYTIGTHPFEWYKDRFDYIIVNSGRYERYFKTHLGQYQSIRHNYEDIEARSELIKQFDPPPFSPNNPNPVVKIYKVK